MSQDRLSADNRRRDELRQALQQRRRDLTAALHDRMRIVRIGHASHVSDGVLDDEESSVVDLQEDLELALIEMKAETLSRIDEAIARLDEGRYGRCEWCGEEIAGSRLRALPFAVRCLGCEEARETGRTRAKPVPEAGV